MACQGGFFPLASTSALLAYGAFLGVWGALWIVAVRPRVAGAFASFPVARLVPTLAFLLVGALYAVSAIVHGLPADSLVQCAPWALGALAAAVCAGLDGRQARALVAGVAWLGVASSLAGALMFAGIPPVGGAVNAGRLQFLFQYANAAGAWFACTALLCLRADDPRLRRCATAPLAALLLTQSMGAILACAVVASACVAVRVVRSGAGERAASYAEATSFLVQGVLAAIVFLLFALPADHMVGEGLGIASLAVATASFYRFWPAMDHRLRRGWIGGTALALSACVLAVGALLVALLLHDRLVQATATFAERALQAGDAWRVLAASPLLGIGPDQWQFTYPAIQSAEYESTLVHNSYLQLGLNAGVLAPAALISAGAWAVAAGSPEWRSTAFPALAILALHALIDFDLEFSFFVVLAAVLMGTARQRS